MKLSSTELKEILIFQEETCRVQKIKKPTVKNIFVFRAMGLSSPKLKKLLYFCLKDTCKKTL